MLICLSNMLISSFPDVEKYTNTVEILCGNIVSDENFMLFYLSGRMFCVPFQNQDQEIGKVFHYFLSVLFRQSASGTLLPEFKCLLNDILFLCHLRLLKLLTPRLTADGVAPLSLGFTFHTPMSGVVLFIIRFHINCVLLCGRVGKL